MRLDVFLNLSTKLILLGSLSQILLSKLNDVQAGLINHICFYLFSTLIWISPAEEEELFGWYRFAVEMGEWGPYEALTPTQKFAIWLRWLWGGGHVGE